MTNEDLIERAAEVVRPHREQDRLFGDVGAALLAESGNLYRGVSIDTGSGTGKDASGTLYVLPRCGRCRLFIEQTGPEPWNPREAPKQ